MKATPIIKPSTKLTKKGNLVYVAVWSVEKSTNYPDGIKYSFTLISKGRRVIGCDYNPAEGHHRHYIREGKSIRENYEFKNLDEIFVKFHKDVGEYEKDI